MANIYDSGNTIVLTAQFLNNVGDPIQPDDFPTLTIYKADFSVLETFNLDNSNVRGTGLYEFYYTIPTGTSLAVYYYEFKGTLNGSIGLNRGQFMAKFQV